MDPATRRPPSGIPRPQSKLPVLRRKPSQTLAANIVAEAPAPAKPTTATPKLQKRQSQASLSRSGAQAQPKAPTATSRRPISTISGDSTSTATTSRYGTRPAVTNGSRPISRGSQKNTQQSIRPSARNAKSREDEDGGDQLGSLDGFRSASRQDFSDDQFGDDQSPIEPEDVPRERKSSRPSLSDRAIESLQRVPTTPKDRRRSSFFAPAESPMGPPIRPTSSSSRASSQTGPGTSEGGFSSRPVTPGKRATASAKPASRNSLAGFGFTPKSADKRRVSSGLTARLQDARDHVPASPNAPPVPKPSAAATLQNDRARPLSKTVGARPAKPRPALDTVFSPADSVSNVSAAPTALSTSKRVVSNSSSALREQIAAARAAARKEKARHDSGLSTSTTRDSAFESDFNNDPFNQAPKDEKHILRNRIRAALTDGKLNISAMNFKTLPDEILKMYETSEMEQCNINWAEVVDPTKFIAADNELEDLSEAVFPDKSAEDIALDDDAPNYPFLGLEMIDLHGNKFQTIPPSLRRLERLTILNLTHNKLETSAFETIAQIQSLKELKLGHNALSGNLPASLAQLTRLEKLELQDNRLLGLPEALRELVNLKVLNLANNQLTALPMEALQQLPLTELDVSKNVLIGSLFPLGGVSAHPTLQSLNVANNSLAALTFSPTLDLPKIQTLNVTNNQLRNLPPVSGWTDLITLAAADNKMSEFPEGFTSLQRLRNVNVTSNDFRVVDPEIARMGALESLILAANPLREKKYLTMSADHIKNDLMAKLEPDEAEEVGDDDLPDGHEIGEEGPSAGRFAMKPNGVLDLAGKGLADDIDSDLTSLLQNEDDPPIKEIHLQSNRLTLMPPSLPLAHSLRILNLSSNPFIAAYLTSPLPLPNLRELTLNTCRLTSLDALTTHLNAPDLRILDVTANRLSGPLPALRTTYPNLTTLWSKDNKFTSISASALHGFHTVNLASNDIDALPADVGLLWDEGLRFLEVGSNAFRVPNYRVLEKGTEATLRWLRDRLPAEATMDGGGHGEAGEGEGEEEWFDVSQE